MRSRNPTLRTSLIAVVLVTAASAVAGLAIAASTRGPTDPRGNRAAAAPPVEHAGPELTALVGQFRRPQRAADVPPAARPGTAHDESQGPEGAPAEAARIDGESPALSRSATGVPNARDSIYFWPARNAVCFEYLGGSSCTAVARLRESKIARAIVSDCKGTRDCDVQLFGVAADGVRAVEAVQMDGVSRRGSVRENGFVIPLTAPIERLVVDTKAGRLAVDAPFTPPGTFTGELSNEMKEELNRQRRQEGAPDAG